MGAPKLGPRLPIALLSFLQLRFFVTCLVTWVSPNVTSVRELGSACVVSGFKHGMASPPPPRALKILHYETPVPLFARSRLSEFKRGSTRASMRPRAPLLQSASLRYLSMSLCGRIEGGRARPPKNGAVPTGAIGAAIMAGATAARRLEEAHASPRHIRNLINEARSGDGD